MLSPKRNWAERFEDNSVNKPAPTQTPFYMDSTLNPSCAGGTIPQRPSKMQKAAGVLLVISYVYDLLSIFIRALNQLQLSPGIILYIAALALLITRAANRPTKIMTAILIAIPVINWSLRNLTTPIGNILDDSVMKIYNLAVLIIGYIAVLAYFYAISNIIRTNALSTRERKLSVVLLISPMLQLVLDTAVTFALYSNSGIDSDTKMQIFQFTGRLGLTIAIVNIFCIFAWYALARSAAFAGKSDMEAPTGGKAYSPLNKYTCALLISVVFFSAAVFACFKWVNI